MAASDFIPGYSFSVNFDGFSYSFGRVSNLGGTIEIDTVVEGGNNDAPVILRKPKRTPDYLILERALHSTLTDVAFSFFKEGRLISAITITVKKNNKTVRMFFITNGVIVQREFSPLDALESGIMLQSLKIAHSGMTELPLPFGL
ncbi:MAG: phage tail protein [Ruminiclostridium sp.]|nr:phage tail protein [Ruminiclostridium sp.]